MEARYFWINVLLLAVGTFLIRGSMVALASRIKITDRTRRIFSYIPAAILPAMVTPAERRQQLLDRYHSIKLRFGI